MSSLSLRSVEPAIDLLSGLALAGVAAMAVARPRPTKPIGRSLLPAAPRAVVPPTRRRASELRQATAELQRLAARYTPTPRRTRQDVASRASRVINGGAALLAASVLADSSVEHYRGSFENRAMYVPLVAAAMTLAANLYEAAAPRHKDNVVRGAVYTAASVIGLVGLGFHAYNILKRPGGVSWLNMFYAAPAGAPAALTLAGMLGQGAIRLRQARPWRRTNVFGFSLGRALAALTSFGLAGNVGEVSLLHFRGNFQNPAMYLPVAAPPVAAALLGAAAARPSRLINTLTRWWLGLTALLGIGGVGFHAYGVARGMGGWRNWSQNILSGPPLPAPPSFTGLALAGLATLSLLDEEADG